MKTNLLLGKEKSKEEFLSSFVTRTDFLSDHLQVGNRDLSTCQPYMFSFDNQIPQPCFVQNLWTAQQSCGFEAKNKFRIYENPNTSSTDLKNFYHFLRIVSATSQKLVHEEKC